MPVGPSDVRDRSTLATWLDFRASHSSLNIVRPIAFSANDATSAFENLIPTMVRRLLYSAAHGSQHVFHDLRL
eukprot:COSAG02_NODE_67146_length_253_cov_1.344156_1_plen_72_part_10